jgi:hypothetical protein
MAGTHLFTDPEPEEGVPVLAAAERRGKVAHSEGMRFAVRSREHSG